MTRRQASGRFVPPVAAVGVLLALGLALVTVGERVLDGAVSAPPPSTGDVYYIAPDGDDAADGTRAHPWRTAIRASEALEPGDTLVARGGRYVGQGGYGWRASGTPDAPITIRSAAGERAVFDGDGLEQWLILDGVHDLVVRDLEITGYRPLQNGVLILIGEARNITLDGLVMEGNASGAASTAPQEHLIYPGAGPVTNLTIRDCLLDASGLSGAAIHAFHDPGPVNLVIEDNDIRGGHWGIIIASNADRVTIRGNRFSDNDINVEISETAQHVKADE